MEENIKRVEKLIHATNSVLAQMKFSMMFDDLSGENNERTLGPEGIDRMLVDKFLNGNDLKQCQNEFRLETNKVQAKVEEMFGSSELNRKHSKAIDRIKEINKQISTVRLEESKPEETEQSRQKLFNLINEEKFNSDVTSSKRSVGSKPTMYFNREKETPEKTQLAPRKNSSLLSITKSPNKSKMELRKNILETQEIVDRGFLTAKQLAQKVEWITKWDKKEKTPSTDKTVSENNVAGSAKKTESNETIKTVKCKKHFETEKKKERIVQEPGQVNTQVIDVKRKEFQKQIKSNLQLQRLPSVHIKGGLKLQRIHNLEIPASGNADCEKLNIAVSFSSHEQIEKKKMEKIIEKIRRENCYCNEDSLHRNYVECFNCGKLNKIRNTWTDPRKIDEILQQCNFNVFDPRIDEFVEKFKTVDFENWCKITQARETLQSGSLIPGEPKISSKDVIKKIETTEQSEQLKKSRHFTLREFSNQIFKKYKQEIEVLENNHLKLDSLLQSLFSKVDESRKLFENCNFLKNLNTNSEKIPNLSSTKPILITLTESSHKNRRRQKKLNKKELNKTKSETQSSEIGMGGKKVFYTASTLARLSESKSSQGVFSCNQLNQNGNFKTNTTELQEKFITSLTTQSQNTVHLGREEEVEEKLPSAISTSTYKSRNANQQETSIKKKNNEKTLQMASIFSKAAKSLDGIYCKEEEMLNGSFVAAFSNKNKITKLSDVKEEKLEKEKIPVVAISVSSNKSSGTYREDLSSVQSKTQKDMFQEKDNKIESPATLSRNKIDSETEETASEKSEIIYESDFESFTNELEGKGNECEEEEPELIQCKKLSTISEVDSELEEKFSDEQQKATKSTYFEMDDQKKAPEMGANNIIKQEENFDLLKQKDGSSVISDISSKSKKGSETSLKSTPTKLGTSLKDVLSALQDQFAKTESLAEKLTENVKVVRREKAELDLAPMMLNTWKMAAPSTIVENLQSARKNWTYAPKLSLPLIMSEKIQSEESGKSEKDLFADSLSDDGGSSLGEIIVSDRGKVNSGKSKSSTISECSFLNLNNAKKSACFSSGQGEANNLSV